MIPLREGRHEYNVSIGKHVLNFECDWKPAAEEAVLFIHGLACSRESFRNVFDRFYFPSRSLLLPDLAGFGKSSKPAGFSYTMEDHAALCEQLLALLPFCTFHLVVHSMGNAVALLFSPALLSRVRSFANLEGNLIGEDCGLLSRGIAGVSLSEYQAGLFSRQRAEFAGHPQLCFEQTTAAAVHKSARSLVQWSDSGELHTRFRQLPCRKIYIWGEENRDMPVLQKLAGVETRMISRSGHGLMTDNPAEFYPFLAEFINTSPYPQERQHGTAT